ncbi:MAG: DEAD/DEAH box helicase [Verrucomicrobia bacterium]|jgi:superfamily II DNA or RNA helicase|nr:DEAD/DEAH box helicase [Verrucomicrobiota bacterium]
MARGSLRNGTAKRPSGTSKYDAHNKVLSSAYGALADLRRELSDSKGAVVEREELLKTFSTCPDSQRAWLLLEDYFEKLWLSRKDFPDDDWWPRVLKASGEERLEELAFVFIRAKRSIPTELLAHANYDRFAQVQEAEREDQLVKRLETWMLPKQALHLDVPKASLRVRCEAQPDPDRPGRHRLAVQFHLTRQRTGERPRSVAELIDLSTRAAHERELFPPADWDFIEWITVTYKGRPDTAETFLLPDADLFTWLARWGHTERLEQMDSGQALQFHGHLAELVPHLENHDKVLSFTHCLKLPDGGRESLDSVQFFTLQPPLALVGNAFYVLRNAPSPEVLEHWAVTPSVPVSKLSHRLLGHLRRNHAKDGFNWDKLCTIHVAKPQFQFELLDDLVHLRLTARSTADDSVWIWQGHEWVLDRPAKRESEKPEILDDPRLEPAVQWLKKLDWFSPEPGLWTGDATENFLGALAEAWGEKPRQADYLGNAAFQRLFLQPRQLKPKVIVKGSGIDWLSVSAEWEAEGMRLSKKDLERLAAATSRFVKLPHAGWVELDTGAVQEAHETMAEIGVDGLAPMAQKVGLEQVVHLDQAGLERFGASPQAQALRERLKEFQGVPDTHLPDSVTAQLRPYQKAGFDFLCHLTRMKLGGILADDMGLGKTLQTLTWLAWLQGKFKKRPKPSLVICPASVLHNWRREAEKFAPTLKVLVLESGAARHNLRGQIPEHDLIVTNYAILRRDLEELGKFSFRAVILDEAQFIKNPGAQVTQSVKQVNSEYRLALTGTPLENRLLDLWSIADFIQPGYLGSQEHFAETYEPKGEGAEGAQRIARKRLSAKLRPLLLRRLKKHVAKDLPDRIEERMDCPLGEDQRKLYLAELRRSREQVMKAVETQGLAKSKMHVLAALTRLRQVCCHPRLVGNDSPSGKTDTLFELLDPLISEGQKVLVFSQFVQMLELLEKECRTREISTHILTGATKDRQQVVQSFQDDERPAVFLLSLRAAGTGLNLTASSYVVLYDPWWNPAVEAQAIDRSHRIGQTQTVNAYRLIAPGTVEEKIWELQQQKAQTIADVLGEEGFARSLSATDLEYLFAED